MRAILLILATVALMLVAVTPVFGSIHEIVESKCAAQESQSDHSTGGTKTAGDRRNPPGQTPGDDIGDPGSLQGIDNSIPNSDGNSESGQGEDNCINS